MATTSKEFYERHRLLRVDIINQIKETLGNRKYELDRFEDEANNYLTAIDAEQVWFHDGDDTYPLGELGTVDMLGLLFEIEN